MGSVRKVRHIERPHVLSIRLSDEELARLNALVEKSGITASDIVRYAIAHYVHRELAA